MMLLKIQEKVEEELFVRKLEAKFFEMKKAELDMKAREEKMAIFEEAVLPEMVKARMLLEQTGDKISDKGCEAIAKWKLDMPLEK